MSFTVWIHGTGTYILMECMLMLSLLSLTVCGGIGVITPMDGEAILIMVGEVTHLIIVTAAGPMVGAASTVAGVGDGDTITIIMPVRIIIDHQDVRRPAVILQEETLPVDIAVVRVAGGIHQIVAVQPVHRH